MQLISDHQSFTIHQGKLILCDADKLQPSHAISTLLCQSFSVYFLNSDGNTLLMNEFGAEICGYDSPSHALGKSLFAVSDEQAAAQLLQNSQQVIQAQTMKLFDELNIRKDKVHLPFLSVKLPWMTADNQQMGSVGFSIVLGRNSLSQSLAALQSLGLLSAPSPYWHGGKQLTPRESQCLELASQHLTAKEIAKRLGISHRTVEEHLTRLKQKFAVNSKKELLQLGNAWSI